MDISAMLDADLAESFKRFPPYERLIASEVHRRWHGLSHEPWLDIYHLDLGPLPCEHIGDVIKQCPNLSSVCATHKSFSNASLRGLPQASRLASVKLYDCRFSIDQNERPFGGSEFAVESLFTFDLPQAAWTELILHDACLVEIPSELKVTSWRFTAGSLPATLTHLQLSGLCAETRVGVTLTELKQLRNLECLILQDFHASAYYVQGIWNVLDELVLLKKLRELAVSPVQELPLAKQLGQFASRMPSLEVLFLHNIGEWSARQLSDLITTSSALRILVLSDLIDAAQPVDVPARNAALPKLHIFLGKAAAEKIRFARCDAYITHELVGTMSDLLAKPELVSIFEGVWIAAQIKETARNGGNLWTFVDSTQEVAAENQ